MKQILKKLGSPLAVMSMAFGLMIATPKPAHAATYLCILQSCDNSYCYYNCYRVSAD